MSIGSGIFQGSQLNEDPSNNKKKRDPRVEAAKRDAVKSEQLKLQSYHGQKDERKRDTKATEKSALKREKIEAMKKNWLHPVNMEFTEKKRFDY